MKLLLDEMWSPEIAVQLRRRGFDVVAVAERPDLRGQQDSVIFSAAQAEGRAIVTENVADFHPLGMIEAQRGGSHSGLIFTSNRRFPRHDPRTPGQLVAALVELLMAGEREATFEHWLSVTREEGSPRGSTQRTPSDVEYEQRS